MNFDCLRTVVSEVPPDLVRDLGGKIRSLDKTLNKESKYVRMEESSDLQAPIAKAYLSSTTLLDIVIINLEVRYLMIAKRLLITLILPLSMTK